MVKKKLSKSKTKQKILVKWNRFMPIKYFFQNFQFTKNYDPRKSSTKFKIFFFKYLFLVLKFSTLPNKLQETGRVNG